MCGDYSVQLVSDCKVTGITPACAGTTACNSSAIARLQGSPLHVRGLLSTANPIDAANRITPACAGTTSSSIFGISFYRDHPCMCGDYYIHSYMIHSSTGSPLHVRGLHSCEVFSSTLFGITPACAGTTCPHQTQRPLHRDHPCMCGDYSASSSSLVSSSGSPLHVRGLRKFTTIYF